MSSDSERKISSEKKRNNLSTTGTYLHNSPDLLLLVFRINQILKIKIDVVIFHLLIIIHEHLFIFFFYTKFVDFFQVKIRKKIKTEKIITISNMEDKFGGNFFNVSRRIVINREFYYPRGVLESIYCE